MLQVIRARPYFSALVVKLYGHHSTSFSQAAHPAVGIFFYVVSDFAIVILNPKGSGRMHARLADFKCNHLYKKYSKNIC